MAASGQVLKIPSASFVQTQDKKATFLEGRGGLMTYSFEGVLKGFFLRVQSI